MGNWTMSRLKYFIVMLLAVIVAGKAYACVPTMMTDAERFEHASAVFYARITRLGIPQGNTLSRATDAPLIGNFELIETFKGKPPEDGSVHEDQTSCSLPLLPGAYYVFFMFDERARSSWGGGSRGFLKADDPEALRMLAELRALKGR
ncbi:hypothetical protein [Ferrovibrio sp.]|uniref:hypothetical protein n=1 Tax=Ferrovibrio sp. TaxID=1917215 RepID=UPI003D0AC842